MGLANVLFAALAFSAPPTLTRRDIFVGMGAAAAAMAQSPAFAAEAPKNPYAGAADRRAAEKKAAELAKRGPDYKTPYEKIVASSKAYESTLVKEAPPSGAYYANGKSESGVSFRNPNDPNACSE